MNFIDGDKLNEFWTEGVLPIKTNVQIHTTAITELQDAVETEQENIDDIENEIETIKNDVATDADIQAILDSIYNGQSGGGSGGSSSGGSSSSVGGGIIGVYIKTEGTTYTASWLSATSATGDSVVPRNDVLYVILTSGDYYNQIYRWNNTLSKYEVIRGIGGGGSSNDDEEIDVASAIQETLDELNNVNNNNNNDNNENNTNTNDVEGGNS